MSAKKIRTIGDFINSISAFNSAFNKKCLEKGHDIKKFENSCPKEIEEVAKEIIKDGLHKGTIIEELRKEKNYINNDEGIGETASWIFSLKALAEILDKTNEDFRSAQIVLEKNYYSGKTPDVTIIGKNNEEKIAIVIIENKRWPSWKNYQHSESENFLKWGEKEILHPCKQVEQYKDNLENLNGYIQDHNQDLKNPHVKLYTAVYIHNINADKVTNDHDLFNPQYYKKILDNNPIFGKDGKRIKLDEDKKNEQDLLSYLQNIIVKGENGLAEKIYNSEGRYSKAYLDILRSKLDNDSIKKKKMVYEALFDEEEENIINKILKTVKDNKKRKKEDKVKTVYIIDGSAGTGKSFMGLALLSFLVGEEDTESNTKLPLYLLKCRDPRIYLKDFYNLEDPFVRYEPVIESVISDEKEKKRTEPYDCIIIDDSQRYQKLFRQPKNNIENGGKDGEDKENTTVKLIIDNSYVSVFFIDESQTVHCEDFITKEKISQYAEGKVNIVSWDLEKQYRMKKRENKEFFKDISFLDFIDCLLDKPKERKENLSGYEFALVDSETELFSLVKYKNRKQGSLKTSRVVAGKNFGWNWPTAAKKNDKDINGPFNGSKYWKYGSDKSFINEVVSTDYIGCVDFCQGEDLEYVGVIIAEDLGLCSDNDKIQDKLEKHQLLTEEELKKCRIVVRLEKHQQEDPNIIGHLTPNEKERISKAKNDDEKNEIYNEIYNEKLDKMSKVKAEEIIKNTYRVLMTRGEKGCYIYCCDPNLRNYILTRHDDFQCPLMKIGGMRVKPDKENGLYGYIECKTDSKKYFITQQTVENMYKRFDKKRVDKILSTGQEVTFIVDINEYAVNIDLFETIK